MVVRYRKSKHKDTNKYIPVIGCRSEKSIMDYTLLDKTNLQIVKNVTKKAKVERHHYMLKMETYTNKKHKQDKKDYKYQRR